MTKPMIRISDFNTGEEIVREMTDAEYQVALAEKTKWETEQAEVEAKAIAKAEAKQQALAALGLSQEIINLLAE